jgi:hypothetical protein
LGWKILLSVDQAPGSTETLRPGPERNPGILTGTGEPARRPREAVANPNLEFQLSKTKVRKGGRRYSRVQTRKAWYEDLPLLPIVVGSLLVVAAVILIVVSALNQPKSTTINGIPCQSNEQLAVHYHAHLSILVGGNEATLPAGIGIDQTAQCLYWMHTHATDGVIHIEAPKDSAARKFTLGDFFDVWKVPLSSTQIASTVLTKGQKLLIFVDAKPYTGNPRNIVLGAHTQVILEVTPPAVTPLPTFTFPAGE